MKALTDFLKRLQGPLQVEPLPLDRALRVHRLHLGKTVVLHSEYERRELEGDYLTTYNVFPVLDYHQHPSIKGEEKVVSLYGAINLP